MNVNSCQRVQNMSFSGLVEIKKKSARITLNTKMEKFSFTYKTKN